MDFKEYLNDGLVKSAKSGAYKTHIIKNIEVIGQRKIVIYGEGDDVELLNSTIAQLRKKDVKIPEIAFSVTNDQRHVKEDQTMRMVSELKGKASAYYVFIVAAYTPVEKKLSGRSGILGDSFSMVEGLKRLGFRERDYCVMNEPCGMMATKLTIINARAGMDDNGFAKKLAGMQKQTEAQLNSYKNKHKGERCFLMGYKKGCKLDEMNTIMNEYTIGYNGMCEYFTRTPLRPKYYVLSDAKHYQGNGKYIEGMECFVAGDIKVFEDKFKKKPTYFNHFNGGFIPQLPDFTAVHGTYEMNKIDDIYYMLQLAIFMGFSEIYLYGMDGIFNIAINDVSEGYVNAEQNYPYPEEAKSLLRTVADFAKSNGIKIYNMSGIDSLDMFAPISFDEVDFTRSKVFGKI